MLARLLKLPNENLIAIIAYIAIVAVLAGRSRAAETPRTRRIVSIAFLLTSLALLLYVRREILRYDQPINPDEALMAANAMLTHYGWLNWNIVDPLTSGPLNSSILAWPYLFGGDITLFSTRLTGIACILGAAAFLFLALRRLSDDFTAIIAIAPALVFFAGTTNPDFTHYSSEQVPILLLAFAIYLFVCSFQADRLRYLLGAAFVLGLVPLAKLQAAPIAAVIGVFVLARAVQTGLKSDGAWSSVRRAAAVVGAALLPALILLVPLSFLGGFDDFIKSYFTQIRLRVTTWHNPVPRLIELAPVFLALLEAYAAMAMVALTFIALGARSKSTPAPIAPTVKWGLGLGLVAVPVAFFSILVSGRAYPHYLLLAVPALILLAGTAITVAGHLDDPRSRRSSLVGWLTLGVTMAIVLPAIHIEQDRYARVDRAGGAFLQGQPFTAIHTLAWLQPNEDDRMVCWGWRSECYVDSAIPPATREATNENQLYRTALRPHFRSRFLADFQRNRPDFVIDAVAPGSFGFVKPETQGIGSFPEFARIIASDFDRVSRVEPPGRCPRLYVRRERLAELEKSLIAFASLDATVSTAGHPATALDDGSIFETCDDNWLLPEQTLGTATIRFHEAGPLRTVAILNTRNGSLGDRGSVRVRLSARLDGKAVASKVLTLKPFPHWTYYKFRRPVIADGVTIKILSYRGAGAGLNEVKAYRK